VARMDDREIYSDYTVHSAREMGVALHHSNAIEILGAGLHKKYFSRVKREQSSGTQSEDV